jgi:hypothetical protein
LLYPLSAGSDAGLVLANDSGVEMSPSSYLVLHPREDPRDSKPLNIHPLAIIEEPILPVA